MALKVLSNEFNEFSSSSSASPFTDVFSRKRNASSRGLESPGEAQELTSATSDFDDLDVLNAEISPPRKKIAQAKVIAVEAPCLSFPKSLYEDFECRPALSDEKDVLDEVLRKEDAHASEIESNTFISVWLQDFCVYRRHKDSSPACRKRPGEPPLANQLVSLNDINERRVGYLLFDGFVCFGQYRRRVQGIPFEVLSIGQYQELGTATVGSNIWVQSFEGKKRDVWYQLGKPSSEYERYQKVFVWIADLAKHVVDYLHFHINVNLEHFRHRFFIWLKKMYGHDKHLSKWAKAYNRFDFRHALIAHANFLYCQTMQVNSNLIKQPVWFEIDPRNLEAIPEQTERAIDKELTLQITVGKQKITQRKTTVTPYVKRCFQNMPWAKFLHSGMSIEENPSAVKVEIKPASREPPRRPIQVGDVIAIDNDEESLWKTEDQVYFAYVQNITVTALGNSLGILWFYRPGDTACQTMDYPFKKEIFLSDHCNCGDAAIYEHDVVYLPHVALFGSPDIADCDFFCRQQYIEAENEWRTLHNTHFRCQCQYPRIKTNKYEIGDTVLVKQRSGCTRFVLEPVVLAEAVPQEIDGSVKVRRLLSKRRDLGFSNAVINELVYTDYFDIIRKSTIERRCQIHFFIKRQGPNDQIPHPYDKQGSGDFFYITEKLRENAEPPTTKRFLEPLSKPWPSSMNQGWLPAKTIGRSRRLKGLDIFCGGGNFGRGVEEGGAVEFEWAVDYFNEAIHTYKANLVEQTSTKLFRGCVNDYLSRAMASKGAGFVAQKGEVEVIISGSPCQGSSLLNSQRGTHDRGLLNESLMASAISFIDFYRPKYALLENVLGIAHDRDEQNVLAQVLCVLVGIGYQVKPFILDAWNFGSPQSRSRVFISCAAPGLEPLEEPPHTHSHPDWVRGYSLGKAANGLGISCRYKAPTPFKYVNAEDAVNDLPATDGRLYCIPFPDHRSSIPLSTIDQVRVQSVPCYPPGMSFGKAVQRGYMPQAQIQNFSWHSSIRGKQGSRCWQRIIRNALMPTVTTAQKPSDGIAGDCLHWDQHRLLTIMEARRAQGFPDDEVIVGEKSQQYKIVGNSVARPVAFALGLSLRKAWTATWEQVETIQSRENRVGVPEFLMPRCSSDDRCRLETRLKKHFQATVHSERNLIDSTVQVMVPLPSSLNTKILPPEDKCKNICIN